MTWPLKLMVYGVGESIDGTGALSPQIQEQLSRLQLVATNCYVAALGELGTDSSPPIRFVLDPAGRSKPEQQAKANLGTPEELMAFVAWTNTVCPAEHSLLILSGHGAAWEDSIARQVLGQAPPTARSLDQLTRKPPNSLVHPRSVFGAAKSGAVEARAVLVDGADRDFLSNAELGAACDRIASSLGGRIDCLLFDACLMSSWEVLHEISGSVSTVVASVDELSAAGVPYANAVTEFSNLQGNVRPDQIASALVAAFTPAASFDTCVAIDLTNVGWSEALGRFKSFCFKLCAWLTLAPGNGELVKTALRFASSSVVRFYAGGLSDVRALLTAFRGINGLPADAVADLDACVSGLEVCVLKKSLGADYTSALGLSIFSPYSEDLYTQNRPDYVRLQMPLLTGWVAVLDTVFGYADKTTAQLLAI